MTPEHFPAKQYDTQLAERVVRLQSLMTPFYAQALGVLHSPISRYRMRTEFRLWHDGDGLYHIMFDSQTKNHICVDGFLAASEFVNTLMMAMIKGVHNNYVLCHRLLQIDYLTILSGQAVVSMLHHKKLDSEQCQGTEALRDALRAENLNAYLIGRVTKTKVELDQDYIGGRLPVTSREITYRQVENSFTRPNAAMNIQMLEWAIDVTRSSRGGLLELYCGNGNFSLTLAQNFNHVPATEVAEPSVVAAQCNITANQIENIQIIRIAIEEFTQAMNDVREFNRLQGIDLKSYQCETIFVDPPHSGLDSETEKMVQAYPRILYILCSLEILCRNLEMLSQAHNVSRLALSDQLPYTHHMECGVLLTKK